MVSRIGGSQLGAGSPGFHAHIFRIRVFHLETGGWTGSLHGISHTELPRDSA